MPGFYERRIFPWINDKLTATPELARMRDDALAPARGRVLEIGFGSGANLPHYPSQVESIVAIDPNPGMHDRAAKGIGRSRIPVDVRLATAEALPVADNSVDTAVSTLTLCSVSDPDRVLRELRRVLRDEGLLILIEHGLSLEPGVARWQRRLNRVQNAVACGCNLDRPIQALVARCGFAGADLRSFYLPNVPRTHGWVTTGVARKVIDPQAGPAS